MKTSAIVYGGKIFSLYPTPHALHPLEALYIADGKIVATGKRSDIENLATAETKRINLEGLTLLPGFNDAHVHVWKVGQLRTTMLDVRGVESLDGFYQAVSERIKALQPEQWLWGRGWNEAKLGGWPTKAALDQIAPRNPVLITRTCAHIHAVNSLALEAASITPQTQVPGGEIDFDKGILYETAYGLVFKAMPAPTQADYQRWVLAGLEYLRSLGITSATDPAVDPPLYAAYKALDAAGKLPIRVNLLYIRRPDGGSETYPLPQKHQSNFLRCDSVKFFGDGGLSGATAALSVNYKNTEGPQGVRTAHTGDAGNLSQGVLRFETEELYQLALEAHVNGFRIGTHAIGDRTLDQVLGIYQRLYQEHPSQIRHRIEHFGLPSDEHLRLAKAMNIMVVPQPVFLHELRGNFLKYLPDQLVCRCYNLKAMFDAGLTVAFSSDGPVVSKVPPLIGIQAAINEPMCEGNGVTLEQALWAYTMGGALAGGDEDNRGSLEAGKWTDFVILDGDLREPSSLSVHRTTVGGE